MILFIFFCALSLIFSFIIVHSEEICDFDELSIHYYFNDIGRLDLVGHTKYLSMLIRNASKDMADIIHQKSPTSNISMSSSCKNFYGPCDYIHDGEGNYNHTRLKEILTNIRIDNLQGGYPQTWDVQNLVDKGTFGPIIPEGKGKKIYIFVVDNKFSFDDDYRDVYKRLHEVYDVIAICDITFWGSIEEFLDITQIKEENIVFIEGNEMNSYELAKKIISKLCNFNCQYKIKMGECFANSCGENGVAIYEKLSDESNDKKWKCQSIREEKNCKIDCSECEASPWSPWSRCPLQEECEEKCTQNRTRFLLKHNLTFCPEFQNELIDFQSCQPCSLDTTTPELSECIVNCDGSCNQNKTFYYKKEGVVCEEYNPKIEEVQCECPKGIKYRPIFISSAVEERNSLGGLTFFLEKTIIFEKPEISIESSFTYTNQNLL